MARRPEEPMCRFIIVPQSVSARHTEPRYSEWKQGQLSGTGISGKVRAYNDRHIDEYCAAHPGRFLPMALPAI
jgi:hypothetical protein